MRTDNEMEDMPDPIDTAFILPQVSLTEFGFKEIRNELGQVTRIEKRDGTWANYTYDDRKNLTRVECSDGSWESWEYNRRGFLSFNGSSFGRNTRYKWDADGRLISKTLEKT